jgi:hypothetical protein
MRSVSDVYGVQINGRDWWIKLTLEEVESDKKHVLVISFHPPEREFTTVAGLELKPW